MQFNYYLNFFFSQTVRLGTIFFYHFYASYSTLFIVVSEKHVTVRSQQFYKSHHVTDGPAICSAHLEFLANILYIISCPIWEYSSGCLGCDSCPCWLSRYAISDNEAQGNRGVVRWCYPTLFVFFRNKLGHFLCLGCLASLSS